jgi:TP901 family phage tail tape measure protein
MAGEEESVLFAFEGDGTSALDALDELDAGMQALDEQITRLAESAGELSALDDAFTSLMESVSQAEEAFTSLSEGLDTLIASGGEAAAALEEVAAAAENLGAAGSGGAGNLEESLVALDETASSVDQALGSLDAALAGTEEAMLSSSQALIVWQDAAAVVEGELSVLDGEFAAADEAANAAAAGADILDASYTVLSETIAATAAAMEGTTVAMEGAGVAAEGTAAKVEALGASEEGTAAKTETMKESAQGAQMQIMMIGMVVAMAAGKFLQMGSKAEDAFAQIQGLAGASASQMDQYKTSLEGMAVQFGTTLDQAASGLYYVISAGFSGSAATTVLANAMEAASAGGVKMQVTASALTSILNSYAAGAGQAQKYTDLMTEAVVQGKQTYGDFSAAIGAAAVTGNAVHVSFDQVAAAEADMTRSGLDAHRSVMDLDFMLRAVALGGGAAAQAAAKKLKISFDANSYASMSLIDKLNYLKEISGGNQASFEKLVGGANGFLAAQILLTNETGNYNQILDAMHHSLGATDAAFQVSQQTISASLGHVQGALSDVSYQITEMIQPAVSAGLNGLAGTFSFVAAHIQEFQPILVGLAAFLVAVFIPALWAVSAPVLGLMAPFLAVAAVIGVVVGALVWLNNSFAPVHAAFASIGGVVSQFTSTVSNAFNLMHRQAEESTLQTKMATVTTTIAQKQALLQQYEEQKQQIIAQMSQTHNAVEREALATQLGVVNAAEKQTKGVLTAALDQKIGITQALAAIDPAVALHTLKQRDMSVNASLAQAQGVIANLARQKQGIEQELAQATSATQKHSLEMQLAATNAAMKQKEGVVKEVEGQKQAIEKAMSEQKAMMAKDVQGNALITMWHTIQTAAGNAASFFQSHVLPVFKQIGGFLASTFGPVGQQLQQLFTGQLMPLFQQLGSAIQGLMPGFLLLGKFVGGILAIAFTLLIGIISGVIKVIAGLAADISSAIAGVVQFVTGIVQVISGIFQFFNDLFHGRFGKLLGDLKTIGAGIANAVGGIFQAVGSVVHGVLGSLGNFFEGFAQGVVGVLSVFGKAGEGVKNLFQTVFTFIGGIFSAIGSTIHNFVNWVVQPFQWLYDVLVGHSIVPDMINGIVQWFTSLPEKVLALVENLATGMFDRFENLRARIIAYVEQLVSAAITLVASWITRWVAYAENLRSQFIAIIQQLVNNVFSILGTLAGQAGQAIQNAVTTILNILKNAATDAMNAGANIVKSIASGITGAIGSAIGGAMNAVGSFISAHLPHSPAKIGPLRDLVLQGSLIPDQIAQGIDANMTRLESTMKKLSLNVSTTLQAQINSSGPLAGPSVNQALPTLPPLPSLPSLPLSSLPGLSSGLGSNQQIVTYLAQIANSLNRMENGNTAATTNVNMHANIHAPAANNPQQLLNVLLGLGGFSYESYQRGASGL